MNRQVALDVLGDLSTGPSLGTPSAPRARYANAKDVEDKLRILSGLIARDREDPSIDMALGKALGARSGDRWTVPEHDDMGEVRAIYKYVRDNVRYTGDAHKLDTFRRPARTLQLRIGDCDDAAALVGAMASAAGFEQGLRVVRTGDSDDFNHVYNVVGLPRTAPQRWVPVDATMNRGVGWEVAGPSVQETRTFLAEGRGDIREISGITDGNRWLVWAAVLVGGSWMLGKLK